MKNAALFACIIAALTMGATSAMAEEIKTKDEFLEQIGGRKLVQGDNWVMLTLDGKVEGQGPKKGKITGTWTWQGPYYCRDITIDGVTLPHDCQAVTKKGDTVTFTHKKGDGVSVSWTIK